MENEIQNQTTKELPEIQPPAKDYTIPASILISAIIIAWAWVYTAEPKAITQLGSNIAAITTDKKNAGGSALEEKVLPSNGVTLPVRWGDLGARIVSVGAIDADKFKAMYDQRGAFTEEYENLLLGQNNGNLKITKDNAGYLLNLFWALGLASKNSILDSGEMTSNSYGGAGNFASTGGWTIVKGSSMDHYSRHIFFALSPEQQALVDKISKGIYRPCCNNSTHFPDCNHGMAMLGFLELMASQGVSEQDMWKAALTVNSYWFPDTYLTIAAYMKNKNIEWNNASPQEMLGINYSSASGYRRIASQVAEPQPQQGGNSCGVNAGPTVKPQRQQGGCGI